LLAAQDAQKQLPPQIIEVVVSRVSTSPEIQFHLFFQSASLAVRQKYPGRLDLDRMPLVVRSLLRCIHEEFNSWLRDEEKKVPDHVDHPPFYFDYIDSAIPNALAFPHEDYSFIGVTMALLDTAWDVCDRLSKSAAIATLLGIKSPTHEIGRTHVVLFRTLLNFVVTHEYTHHVHGHLLLVGSNPTFHDEILLGDNTGSLGQQALEVDADGCAAYHVLANLIDGGMRSQAVSLLGIEAETSHVQERVLLSCFVIATGAYLFLRPIAAIDKTTIYGLPYPPQVARMRCLMEYVIAWCNQNRPDLAAWIDLDQVQILMNAAVEATLATAGDSVWGAQAAFLQSPDGKEYFDELNRELKAHTHSR
jgi:hypothetical protein